MNDPTGRNFQSSNVLLRAGSDFYGYYLPFPVSLAQETCGCTVCRELDVRGSQRLRREVEVPELV